MIIIFIPIFAYAATFCTAVYESLLISTWYPILAEEKFNHILLVGAALISLNINSVPSDKTPPVCPSPVYDNPTIPAL